MDGWAHMSGVGGCACTCVHSVLGVCGCISESLCVQMCAAASAHTCERGTCLSHLDICAAPLGGGGHWSGSRECGRLEGVLTSVRRGLKRRCWIWDLGSKWASVRGQGEGSSLFPAFERRPWSPAPVSSGR